MQGLKSGNRGVCMPEAPSLGKGGYDGMNCEAEMVVSLGLGGQPASLRR